MRLFLFLSLWLPSVLHAQWSVFEPYGDELEDIQFVDRLNGYAVGRDNGIGSCSSSISAIYRTADGGETWHRNATDDSYEMTSVFFLDQQHGWASGYFGDSYRTTDCGQTWTRFPTNTGLEMQDIFFIDINTGFLVGENGRVLKSTNGGQSWSFTYFDTEPDLNAIAFFDDQFGIAVGRPGRILRTIDQGENWEDISPDEGFNYLDIEFITEDIIIVTGSNIVLRSEDAGLSWTSVFDGQVESIRSVEFISEEVGFFGSNRGRLFRSEDAGLSWSQINFPFDEDIHCIEFVDQDLGYISGNVGSIFQTTDGGLTWTSQLNRVRSPLLFGISNNLNDVHFIDPDHGIIAGSGGTVGMTNNGGLTWSRKAPITYRSLFGAKWIDEDRLIAVGDSGTVLRSLDGGDSWNFQELDTDKALLEVWFYEDGQTGYTLSDSLLYLSTDAGVSWSSITLPEDEFFRSFDFLDPDYGVLIGSDNVYYTIDGGMNWEVSNVIEDIGILRSIDIVNDTLSFLGASNVMRSIDGSMSFDSISSNTSLSAQEIEMINDTLGFLLTTSNVRITTNGGRFWGSVSTACLANTQGFNALAVVDANHAFAVGPSPGVRLWSGERRTRVMLTDSVFCLESKFNLTYRFEGARWGQGNTFVAELSDADGSFDTPIALGSYVNPLRNINPSGVISCQLPSGVEEGNGYRIRVIMEEIDVSPEDNGFDIRLTSALAPSITLEQNGGLCLGDPLDLQVSATEMGLMPSFEWVVNDSLLSYNGMQLAGDGLMPGDQVVASMTISSACTNATVTSDTLTIAAPIEAQLLLSNDTTVMDGTPVQLNASGGIDYVWSPMTYLDSAGIADPISTPDSSITYVVTMTDELGCTDTDSLTIIVIPLIDGLDELDSGLSLWPNPSSGQIFIKPAISLQTSWQLFDLQGRLVRQGILRSGDERLEFSSISEGQYLLRLGDRSYQVILRP